MNHCGLEPFAPTHRETTRPTRCETDTPRSLVPTDAILVWLRSLTRLSTASPPKNFEKADCLSVLEPI